MDFNLKYVVSSFPDKELLDIFFEATYIQYMEVFNDLNWLYSPRTVGSVPEDDWRAFK